jgi:hypothetical protein
MLYQELFYCSRQPARQKPTRDRSAEAPDGQKEGIDRCEGLTEEQLQDPIRWARVAADAKDYFGRQLLGAALRKTPEGFQVFNDFWLDGNISGLPGISITYVTGAATGEPDFLRAYAHSLIYFKIVEAAHKAGVSRRSGSRAYSALKDRLRYLSGNLNPAQQKEAETLAARMLADNKNCCVGSF